MGNVNTGDETQKSVRRLLNPTALNEMKIYRHNTRKQINHLAFRVNLAETLFQQFTDNERKYQVAGRQKISFRNCRKVISSKKFLLLGKNQHHRGDVWYAPNTDGGKKQDFAVYSVMLGCVQRNGLKPSTHLIHVHD
jgi:hypothetical protein